MSSHREAPGLSKDPVADNTDLYAFISPDRPDTVTIIANYIPLQFPAGGPNFFEFGDDVAYDIHISNGRRPGAAITYRFRFQTSLRNDETFLYNTGPIDSLTSTSWNRRQFYSVTKIHSGKESLLAQGLACPPVNIGPRSTPSYTSLADPRSTLGIREVASRGSATRASSWISARSSILAPSGPSRTCTSSRRPPHRAWTGPAASTFTRSRSR